MSSDLERRGKAFIFGLDPGFKRLHLLESLRNILRLLGLVFVICDEVVEAIHAEDLCVVLSRHIVMLYDIAGTYLFIAKHSSNFERPQSMLRIVFTPAQPSTLLYIYVDLLAFVLDVGNFECI